MSHWHSPNIQVMFRKIFAYAMHFLVVLRRNSPETKRRKFPGTISQLLRAGAKRRSRCRAAKRSARHLSHEKKKKRPETFHWILVVGFRETGIFIYFIVYDIIPTFNCVGIIPNKSSGSNRLGPFFTRFSLIPRGWDNFTQVAALKSWENIAMYLLI